MKTAVEYIKEKLMFDEYWYENMTFDQIFEQAKEMEKEQMLNAFQESRLTHPMIGFKHETFVEYYKQFKQQE
jgi:hypothetical protein